MTALVSGPAVTGWTRGGRRREQQKRRSCCSAFEVGFNVVFRGGYSQLATSVS